MAIALTPSPGRPDTGGKLPGGQGQDCGGPGLASPPTPSSSKAPALPTSPASPPSRAPTRVPEGHLGVWPQRRISLLSTGHTALGVGSHLYMCILNPFFFPVALSPHTSPPNPISILKKPIYLVILKSVLFSTDPFFRIFCAPCLMCPSPDI